MHKKKIFTEEHKALFWVLLFILIFFVCCFLPDVKRKENKTIETVFDVDPVTQMSHIKYDNDKIYTSISSFGSPEEDMLVCIDARGNRNFKRIIVVEEK